MLKAAWMCGDQDCDHEDHGISILLGLTNDDVAALLTGQLITMDLSKPEPEGFDMPGAPMLSLVFGDEEEVADQLKLQGLVPFDAEPSRWTDHRMYGG